MKPEALTEGQVCFLLGYEDKNLRIPYIQTLIFVGRDVVEIDGRDTAVWCFENPRLAPQEASSGAGGAKRQGAANCCIARKDLDDVLDLGRLIEKLRKLEGRFGGT